MHIFFRRRIYLGSNGLTTGKSTLLVMRVPPKYRELGFLETIDFREDWVFNFAQPTAWAYLFIAPFRLTGSMSLEFLFPGVPLYEQVCLCFP